MFLKDLTLLSASMHTHIIYNTEGLLVYFSDLPWNSMIRGPTCCVSSVVTSMLQDGVYPVCWPRRDKIGAGNIPTKESPWHNSCFLNLASSTSKYLVGPVCRSLERFQ